MNFSSKKSLLWILILLSTFFASCDAKGKIVPQESKGEISLSTQNGTSLTTLPKEGGQFLLNIKASGNWKVSSDGEAFLTIDPSTGTQGEYALIIDVSPNKQKERKATLKATILSGEATATFKIIQQGETSISGDDNENTDDNGQEEPDNEGQEPGSDDNNNKPDDNGNKPGKGEDNDSDNETPNLGEEHILGDISLLEMPRPSGDKKDYLVTHKVENGKVVNFSLEYNIDAHHARWVCFSFDHVTNQKNTKRSDAWSWDPMIPSKYEVSRHDFEKSIFARGHIVASHDRVFSVEANKQTFYYTNMSPQRHELNTGVWLQMERIVQNWGRSLKTGEVLYVAKGGTIRKDQIEKHRSNDKLVVPKYYWMALLKKSKSGYSAIALLVEHSKPKKVARLINQALSIDELEKFTGIDFFYNLPDKIENKVESLSPQQVLTDWPGL